MGDNKQSDDDDGDSSDGGGTDENREDKFKSEQYSNDLHCMLYEESSARTFVAQGNLNHNNTHKLNFKFFKTLESIRTVLSM